MAHRIDGRKLGRKMGPRLALYKNLMVSVLRYERVRTTEARAGEVRGMVYALEAADRIRAKARASGSTGCRSISGARSRG